MAFDWKLEIKNNIRCGEVELYDITGTDETGWGNGTTNPNPLITGVTAAEAKIVFSNGAFWTGSILSTVPVFPNLNGIPLVINSTLIGQRPPDGKVTVEAWIAGDINGSEGVLAKEVATGYLTCNALCCIMDLHSKVPVEIDPCDSKEWKAWDSADRAYRGLLYAIECEKYDKADQILADIKAICAGNGAKCGGC